MKRFATAAALVLVGSIAHAGEPLPPAPSEDSDPTLFLGLSWTFGSGGGKPGATAKIISSDEIDKGALAAGVTYNFDGTWGCDLGVAYNEGNKATATLTYDFCQQGAQVGIGGNLSSSDPNVRVVD